MRWLPALALIVCLSGFTTRVAAQALASLDAGVADAAYDGYLSSAVYTLAPSFVFAGGPVRLGFDGAFGVFETGHTSGNSTLSAAVGTPISGPWRWELSGEGSALWYRTSPAIVTGLLSPHLHFDRGPLAAWAGGAVGSTHNDGLPGSFVNRVDAGVSYAWPHLTPALTIASTRAGIAHYTDFGGVIQSEIGPLALSAAAGKRWGVPIPDETMWSTWFNAEARWTVVRGVAIVVSGGSSPVDLVGGAPGVHYIGFGVRLSHPFRLRRPPATAEYSALNGTTAVMPDARTLRFSAAPNAHVEMMADFTDWQPVPMTEVRPGLYQATLPDAIRSGLHRVNIRVDNSQWRVPAELSPVTDDLGGTAGSLVVP